jgi:hypothetical protein
MAKISCKFSKMCQEGFLVPASKNILGPREEKSWTTLLCKISIESITYNVRSPQLIVIYRVEKKQTISLMEAKGTASGWSPMMGL